MPEPLFESRTARFDLPLLFAGQAQKEIHINEASARIDALLFGVIEDRLNTPPETPDDGQAWLIDTAPTGDWSGQAGRLALRQAEAWLFADPVDGMKLFNRAAGQEWRYLGAWFAPVRPAAPTGGTTIDSEARSVIGQILIALATAGLIPQA